MNKRDMKNISKIVHHDSPEFSVHFLKYLLRHIIRGDSPIIEILRKVRAVIKRSIYKKENYLNSKNLKPISTIYGFDRGMPVDRFYIEKFIETQKKSIRGRVVEIVDDKYIRMFGKDQVTKADVIDLFPTKLANIHADLRNMPQVKSNTYDCVVITQTYNVMDDFESGIKEVSRILKPGGVVLVTVPVLSPGWNLKVNFWRFGEKGLKSVFGKYFKTVKVQGLGNQKACEYFWVGMATNDMTKMELEKQDDKYPLIYGVVGIKG